MSGDRYTIECKDGEMLIDGQPTDFAPPWKTENAIRQQARDIAELREKLAAQVQATARIATERAMEHIRADAAERDLAAAVAERDLFARQNGNLSIRLASAIARLAAIDAAPVVATVREVRGNSFTYRELEHSPSGLPYPGCELIAKPAKD